MLSAKPFKEREIVLFYLSLTVGTAYENLNYYN